MDVLFDVNQYGYQWVLIESAPCTRTIYFAPRDKTLPPHLVQEYAEKKGERIRIYLPYVQYLVPSRRIELGFWRTNNPYISFSLEPFNGSESLFVPPLTNVGINCESCMPVQYGSSYNELTKMTITSFWNTTFNDDMGASYENVWEVMQMSNWWNDFGFYKANYLERLFKFCGIPAIKREPL